MEKKPCKIHFLNERKKFKVGIGNTKGNIATEIAEITLMKEYIIFKTL